MTNEDKTVLTRRKALTRLGVFAVAAYTIPAVTTLSMAHASSGGSAASAASGGSSNSGNSGPSDASDPSAGSDPSTASTASGVDDDDDPSDVCGPENLDDPDYVTCLEDNGYKVKL